LAVKEGKLSKIFLSAGIEVKYDVGISTRDKIRLSADIYFPQDRNGPLPVILSRTPYDNTAENMVYSGNFYAQHGYIFVAQDTRGRYDSEGDFHPWINEFDDGYDTIEWIGEQEWCDGNVGMVGASYGGNVQWQAAAMGSKYLKAIVPRVIGNNLYESPHYQGGAFQLNWSATWCLRMAGRTSQKLDGYNWEQLFQVSPLRKLPSEGGKDIFYYQEWMDHPDYDDYWKRLANEERYGDVKIPVLQIGGWYESQGRIQDFENQPESCCGAMGTQG
jgi:hypothetical protein